MRDNALQFGAVREDARLEREVLTTFSCARPLMVASAGCSVLALAQWFPQLSFTAIDPNPAQLSHACRRLGALRDGAGLDEHSALSESGNFESLFRLLRGFVHDVIVPGERWLDYFAGTAASPLDDARTSPMWHVAFELAFAEPVLVAMFGPAAIQHARRGSYPGYFRAVIEDGLSRPAARHNPFLHHIFLGHYLAGAEPDYYGGVPAQNIRFEHGVIEDADFGAFDFIGLSNVVDWMDDAALRALMTGVAAQTRPGTVVMFRQLNNDRPLYELLGSDFQTFHELGESLRARDRSLFYRRIHVCRRT